MGGQARHIECCRTQSGKGLCTEYLINGRADRELQVHRTWGRGYRGGVGLTGSLVVWGEESTLEGWVCACLFSTCTHTNGLKVRREDMLCDAYVEHAASQDEHGRD